MASKLRRALRQAGRFLSSVAGQESSSIRPQGIPTSDRTREIGRSGVHNYHGFITEDFNSDFHGERAVRIYDEMRKSDATVAAVLQALKLPILAAERTIESADANDDRQNEIAEFVRSNLFDTLENGFLQFLREALGHLDFGYFYFEKVFEVVNGEVRLKKLAPRLPSAHFRWTMQSTPDMPGVTQLLPTVEMGDKGGSMREIPMWKVVLFTNAKEGDNPEGVSILRSAYKHYYMKDTLYRIDAITHERGAGILVIGLPEGHSNEDKADAEELGENFKINEQAFIVKPDKWTVEMLTAGIESQSAPRMESIKHHDRAITMNILAQFLDLGSGASGSYALSKDQTSFFGLALQAIAANVEATVNEQIIKELVELNFGEQEAYPRLAFAKIGEIDYTEMAGVIEKLNSAGLVKNDPQLKVWIHKTFGLPEVSVEDFEEEDAAAAAADDEAVAGMDDELAALESELDADPEGDEPPAEDINEPSATPEEPKLGEPMSAETKKKISDALKKGGSGEDGEIKNRRANIAKAQADMVKLRADIKALRAKGAGLKGKERKAFVAGIKEKIVAIRAMIKAGTVGSQVEGERIRQRKVAIRTGKFAERRFFRKLTLAEERVQFAEVEGFFDDIEDKLLKELGRLTGDQKAKLLRDIERIVDTDDIAAVADLSLLKSGAVAETVMDHAKAALEKGKATAAKEMGISIPTTSGYTKKALAAKVSLWLKKREDTLTDTVKERLIGLLNNDVGKAKAMFELEKIIDKNAERENNQLAGRIVVDSFDEGRYLSFDDMKDQLHGMQRSEILDDATCAMCMSLDGKVLAASDPFTQVGQIHDHCRGMWVGILKSDAELPAVKELPKSILSRFERADGVPFSNAFRQLPEPIVTKGSRVERKIQDGELAV